MVTSVMTIADWLTEQRRSRGMGPTAFARLLGVSTQSVINWTEGGMTPREEQCIKIAAALGADLDFILRLAGHPVRRKPQPEDAGPREDSGAISFPLEEFEALTPEQQEDVLAYLRFRRQQRKK